MVGMGETEGLVVGLRDAEGLAVRLRVTLMVRVKGAVVGNAVMLRVAVAQGEKVRVAGALVAAGLLLRVTVAQGEGEVVLVETRVEGMGVKERVTLGLRERVGEGDSVPVMVPERVKGLVVATAVEERVPVAQGVMVRVAAKDVAIGETLRVIVAVGQCEGSPDCVLESDPVTQALMLAVKGAVVASAVRVLESVGEVEGERRAECVLDSEGEGEGERVRG